MTRHSKSKKAKSDEKTAEKAPHEPDDFSKIGPTSIEGVEADDLPDEGRGDVFTDPAKEAGRKLPQQTGQWGSGDTGLRGDPDVADAADHGHRKHN